MALLSEWACGVKTHILNINNTTLIIFEFVIYGDGNIVAVFFVNDKTMNTT